MSCILRVVATIFFACLMFYFLFGYIRLPEIVVRDDFKTLPEDTVAFWSWLGNVLTYSLVGISVGVFSSARNDFISSIILSTVSGISFVVIRFYPVVNSDMFSNREFSIGFPSTYFGIVVGIILCSFINQSRLKSE